MRELSVRAHSVLRAGSAWTVLAVAGVMASHAFAQAAPSDQPVTTSPNNTTTQTPTSPELQTPAPGKGANGRETTTDQKGEQAIVITGTVAKQTQTASPVTVVSASNLQDRGITTVADAIQSLSANNAGTDPASWSTFGFATGASAPSLRGFNDAYTITLFDGLRSAVYPLADDGFRNFVDINTIPESIVDRIEVLQDGASANYGADAIAGVVNVIVKKEIRGIHANGSYGISQKGDSNEKRFDLTLGYGSLRDQGFNVYVNGEYQKNDPLYMRDRGYPFNTGDQSRMCGTSVYDGSQTCNTNFVRNGIQFNGDYLGFGATTVGFVAPFQAPNVPQNGTGTAWQYQLLNSGAGCQGLPSVTLSADQRAGSPGSATNVAPATVCQQDLVNQYQMYSPQIERKGLNLHGTVNITPDIQAYAMANWYNTKTDNLGTPENFAARTPAGGTQVTASPIYLPAYVCNSATPVITSLGVSFTGCDATNGTLNPNNPFAAQGYMARLSELYNQPTETLTDATTKRLSGGVSGSFSGFNFNVDATHSIVDLDVTNKNYIYLKNLLSAIGAGTYNFVDQNANTQAQRDFIAPTITTHSVSKLTEVQGVISRDLFSLPGGNVNLAVGAAWRHESLNNPSANPANDVDPTARYYTLNAVGAIGARSVWSGLYSLDVPAFQGFDFKAEGRYDHYSTGQKAFSPKFDFQYRVIPELKLRGTYSRGFRVPSFNEAFGLPTTGYINSSINCNLAVYADFCAAHATNKAYYQGTYSYGLTSVGNPSLAPEKSNSWTAGAVFEPSHLLTMTVDFWHTKIKNIIVPATSSTALINEYYQNNGQVTDAPPGVTLLPGQADPLNPTALPLLGYIQASYTNADSEVGSGVDLSATARVPLNHNGLRLISSLSASYLAKLTLSDPQNGVQAYAGSLGPCNITSCSGAPRWRGTWQNTVDFGGRASVSLTGYYTSGYSEISTDTGGILGDCIGSAEAGSMSQTYYDGSPILCGAKATWDFDLTGQVKLLNKVTLYGNVLNLFNQKPPYDPNAAYGIYQFNPAWANQNFVGRFFRIGARVDW